MMETAWTEAVAAGTSDTFAYPAVSAADLGFAMSVFVAAASRRLVTTQPGAELLSEEEFLEQQNLFAGLVAHATMGHHSKALPYQASLREAFTALWQEHRTHGQRAALCARVLCFHFLMERTAGSILSLWTSASADDPEVVDLDPAVVEGLAHVPLIAGSELNEAELLSAIAQAHRAQSRA